MPIDIGSLATLGIKFISAIGRLQDLIKSGAVQKDIDDQKAVIKEIYGQIETVLGIS